MNKGKALRWGTFTAAVAVVATLAVPALASVKESVGGRAAGGASDVAVDDQLLALSQDLGLTREQATARLAKEAWATGMSARLNADLGQRFAGAWLNADASELMIGVTSEQAAAKVRAAGATPKLVSRNAGELNTLMRRIDTAAARKADGVVGWHVDVATNALVMTVLPNGEPGARALITKSGVPAGAVRVVVTNEAPVPLFDVRGGDAFSINSQARCSVGFSVEGGFITAGHCGQAGSTTSGFNNVAQGTFQVSSFPTDDFAFVEVNDDWDPVAAVVSVRAGNGRGQGQGNAQRINVAVAGAQEAPVGTSVCRTGSTTGTRCGVIQAKNASVTYPECVVTGMTQTNACAEGGDSGGPFFSGNQAQGLTSGGSGNCRVGGTTFFQPIGEVLAKNNLTLVTAAGDQGQGQGGQGQGQNGATPTPAATGSPKAPGSQRR